MMIILLSLAYMAWLAIGAYGFYLGLTNGEDLIGEPCPIWMVAITSTLVATGPFLLLSVLGVGFCCYRFGWPISPKKD